jgi:hypothetical protein
MSELFRSYQGGAFSSVLPTMMNAAMQQRNRVPRYNVPQERGVGRSPAVASDALSQRQAMLAPFRYQQFQDQTLGEVLAGINEIDNLTETETVQVPVTHEPAGHFKGTVDPEEYGQLEQSEAELSSIVDQTTKDQTKYLKEYDDFNKAAEGKDLTSLQLKDREEIERKNNEVDLIRQEAERLLQETQLAKEDNIARGGGPMHVTYEEASREVPASMGAKRDAAMNMVSSMAGKLGGKEMAQLYAEVDRLYPTDKIAETHRTEDGQVLGWKPSGMNTFIQKKPNQFNPNVVLGGQWEATGMSIDQYGQPRYNYAPTQTPKRAVYFPGNPVMYAASDAAAQQLNAHMQDHFAMNNAIDKLINIAESVQWDENWFDKLNPEVRATVNQLQTILVGKLRVPLVGPGVVSNFDYEQLTKAISDPTAFEFQNIISGGRSSVIKLNILKEQLNNSLIDKAAYAGLTVPGAKQRLPEIYRKFDDIETARMFGFQAGDIIYIKGVPGRGAGYSKIRLKPPVSGTATPEQPGN